MVSVWLGVSREIDALKQCLRRLCVGAFQPDTHRQLSFSADLRERKKVMPNNAIRGNARWAWEKHETTRDLVGARLRQRMRNDLRAFPRLYRQICRRGRTGDAAARRDRRAAAIAGIGMAQPRGRGRCTREIWGAPAWPDEVCTRTDLRSMLGRDLNWKQRQQVCHANILAELRQEGRRLAAMMRLMIEEVKHQPGETFANSGTR